MDEVQEMWLTTITFGIRAWCKQRHKHKQHSSESTRTGALTAFNADGFSLGADGAGVINADSGETYASWTFRKAPRFFDVVTWSGTANQTIQHSLGVEPGCIIVKRVGASEDWWVFHRSVATDLKLNLTSAALGYSVISSVTSTTFNVNINTTSSPDGYVAYLFAHDPLGPSEDGSDGLIACGSYTGSGAATGNQITLGWEPQWLLVKKQADWQFKTGIGMFDNMRGVYWLTALKWLSFPQHF
jgi:hypothetical protein